MGGCTVITCKACLGYDVCSLCALQWIYIHTYIHTYAHISNIQYTHTHISDVDVETPMYLSPRAMLLSVRLGLFPKDWGWSGHSFSEKPLDNYLLHRTSSRWCPNILKCKFMLKTRSTEWINISWPFRQGHEKLMHQRRDLRWRALSPQPRALKPRPSTLNHTPQVLHTYSYPVRTSRISLYPNPPKPDYTLFPPSARTSWTP